MGMCMVSKGLWTVWCHLQVFTDLHLQNLFYGLERVLPQLFERAGVSSGSRTGPAVLRIEVSADPVAMFSSCHRLDWALLL